MIMRFRSNFSFLPLFCFLVFSLPAFAEYESVSRGVGPDTDSVTPPAALCHLINKTNNHGFCSGTLIKGGRLVTAGHCMPHTPLKDIRVECGCSKEGCNESFDIKESDSELKTRSLRKKKFGPMREDHAVLTLSHEPKVTEPVETAKVSDYFDESTRSFKPGVECFKGGYGVTENSLEAKVPTLFRVGNIHAFETQKNSDQTYQEVVASVSPDLYKQCLEETMSDINDFKKLVSKETFGQLRMVELIRNLNDAGLFKDGSLLPGDSGGAVYCRRNGEEMKLVALNSTVGYGHSSRDKTGEKRVEIVNNFIEIGDWEN